MEYKAIFIDIDNTLLDFDEYVKSCIRDGFKKFNIAEYDEHVYEIFTRENNKLWRRIEEGTLTFEGLKLIRWNIIFECLGIKYDGVAFEKYFREYLNDSAIPVEGSKELLEFLDKKAILCSASNGPYDQQVRRLSLAGYGKYFSYNFISGKFGYSKPTKEFFDCAFKELNEGREEKIRPEECLMIGDSMTSDIDGACHYGMKTCLFLKNTLHMKMTDTVPDYKIEKLRSIIEILK